MERRYLRLSIGVLCCTLAVFMSGMASAQTTEANANSEPEKQSEESALQLPPLDITASPIVQRTGISDGGARIDIVGQEQIEETDAHDLADALRRVPGVSISRFNMVGSYGGGRGGGVFIRGHGSARPGGEISTQIAGIPRFNGVWTHPLLDTLSTDIAERIEVRKSAAPVTGGNMSFASVNIVPKRAKREGYHGSVKTAVGAYDTWLGKFDQSGKSGKFDYYIAGSHRESDGHRDNSAGETNNIYGLLGYSINPDWDISLLLNHTDGWAEDPRAENAPSIPTTEKYNTDSEFYLLTLKHSYENLDGHIKFYYEDGWAKWEQWDGKKGESKDHYPLWDNYGIQAQENLSLWEGNKLTLGTDWDVATGKAEDVYPDGDVENYIDRREFQKLGPYARLSQTFGETVKVTPSVGIRYTDTRHFGDDFMYQAGVVANYKDTEVYANYANAKNYPGIYTVMFYENFWSFMGNPNGWQDISPEELDHYELGISHKFSENMNIDVSYFQDKVKNKFLIVAPPPTFENIGSYTSEGVETTLTYYPVDNLDIFLGGSFNDTDPADIPNAPEWTGSMGLEYRMTDRFTVNLDAEYVDSHFVVNTRSAAKPQEKVDDHLLANARLSYKLMSPEARTQTEVYVSVKNIADVKYEYQPGYPMPGTTWMTGLKLTF